MTENFQYTLKRHDSSKDKSLRAWSAADEYILQRFLSIEKSAKHLTIYNDRFGYLACQLHAQKPTLILCNKSQEKAINLNLKAHHLHKLNFANPLSSLENKMDFATIKIPKSLALFQLFLEHIVNNSTDDVVVVTGFMTRHFSPRILEIAEMYFEEAEQSKALKKARLLVLSKKKQPAKLDLTTSVSYKDSTYRQYPGVFSADHIDYATQALLEHLEIKESDQRILDLASGNGVIGHQIQQQLPKAEIHLMDDFYLAVESAKLNIKGDNVHHHFNNDLSIFEDDSFDLIVSNPPFHFEYEINIQIPIQLFKESARCLKKGGSLQLVANKHLNYRVHLEPLFSSVENVTEGEKFIVYKCVK